MSNEKRWLQPPKESKYDSSWFVSPIVKNKPDIYSYKKKPLSNDDTPILMTLTIMKMILKVMMKMLASLKIKKKYLMNQSKEPDMIY